MCEKMQLCIMQALFMIDAPVAILALVKEGQMQEAIELANKKGLLYVSRALQDAVAGTDKKRIEKNQLRNNLIALRDEGHNRYKNILKNLREKEQTLMRVPSEDNERISSLLYTYIVLLKDTNMGPRLIIGVNGRYDEVLEWLNPYDIIRLQPFFVNAHH